MHIPHEIKLLLWAMAPVVELRGAIVYGLTRSINPFLCYFLACLGSSIIIPPLYYLLMPFLSRLGRLKGIGSIFLRLQKKAIKQSNKLGKFQFVGLMLFVGIPLPGTGAWTGCMIASILNVPISTTLYAITLGNMLAGIIVLIISHGTIKILN